MVDEKTGFYKKIQQQWRIRLKRCIFASWSFLDTKQIRPSSKNEYYAKTTRTDQVRRRHDLPNGTNNNKNQALKDLTVLYEKAAVLYPQFGYFLALGIA